MMRAILGILCLISVACCEASQTITFSINKPLYDLGTTLLSIGIGAYAARSLKEEYYHPFIMQQAGIRKKLSDQLSKAAHTGDKPEIIKDWFKWFARQNRLIDWLAARGANGKLYADGQPVSYTKLVPVVFGLISGVAAKLFFKMYPLLFARKKLTKSIAPNRWRWWGKAVAPYLSSVALYGMLRLRTKSKHVYEFAQNNLNDVASVGDDAVRGGINAWTGLSPLWNRPSSAANLTASQPTGESGNHSASASNQPAKTRREKMIQQIDGFLKRMPIDPIALAGSLAGGYAVSHLLALTVSD